MTSRFVITDQEIKAIIAEVQTTIGVSKVVTSLAAALGADGAAKILSGKMDESELLDKTGDIICALLPLIPGATVKEKMAWVYGKAKIIFSAEGRFDVMFEYVINEIEELAGIAQPNTSRELRPIRQGDTQPFYGRVNFWALDRGALDADLYECGKSGVNYMIEMAGWGNTGIWNDQSKLDAVCAEYRYLVSECRKRKLHLFVSVVNDNMHLSKYGNVGIRLGSVLPQAYQLVSTIKECGPENVLVQPVAETQTADGLAFESYCAQELADFELVYNGEGGSPSKKAGWSKWRAIHPSSASASVPSDAFAVSDHGNTIRQLNEGGGLETNGNPTTIRSFVAKHAAAGCPMVGVYHFKQQSHDQDAIRACALQQAQEPTPDGVDAVPFSLLQWSNGGFNGSGAALSAPRLSNLVFNGNKQITFKWDVGMESWGLAHGDASAVASIFFEHADGVFRGGRFEWISTSRTQRDLANIYTSKFNFNLTGLPNPCRGALVVTDAEGSKRANVVAAMWSR